MNTEFCVNWVSFKNSISEGFSRLQQNGEFVDMTLAAEGHLVQVHKNIVALASPYLKAMIQSVTCEHPVIFLNKINYRILGFILEYIYTGEVKIPSDVLPMFIDASKELHLNGVENLDMPKTVAKESLPKNLGTTERYCPPLNRVENLDLPRTAVTESIPEHLELTERYHPPLNAVENLNLPRTVAKQSLPENLGTTERFRPPLNGVENLDFPRTVATESVPEHLRLTEKYCSHLNGVENIDLPTGIGTESLLEHLGTTERYHPHLNAVDNLDLPIVVATETLPERLKPTESTTERLDNNFAAHITINSENYNIEVRPINNTIQQDKTSTISSENYNVEIIPINSNVEQNRTSTINSDNYNVEMIPIDNNMEQDNTFPILDNEVIDTDLLNFPIVDKEEHLKELIDECISNVKPHKTVKTILPKKAGNDKSQHYSISNRGSLQLLLNRYMYYCHHYSCEGRRRRWRCIDYRKMQCPAVIDTYDDNIINRSEMHCHSYHDAKILKKFKSQTVFTSIIQAQEKITPKKRVRNKLNKNKDTAKL